eukprot:8028629-Prorocentrum_lima.AAC.1
MGASSSDAFGPDGAAPAREFLPSSTIPEQVPAPLVTAFGVAKHLATPADGFGSAGVSTPDIAVPGV